MIILSNKRPLWIAFSLLNSVFSFGFCYKLEVYLDDTNKEKPQLKTRKIGYRWFYAYSKNKPVDYYTDLYNKVIKRRFRQNA